MTLKLLVADDSVTIQKIISLAFFAEDAAVHTVSNGDAVMDAMREFRPDVVLVDVFMPGCGGYEICERIKKDQDLRNTPVILLVGAFEPFDESEASRAGCDGYFTKPFDTLEIIETVHSLVEGKMLPANGETPNDSQALEAQATEPAKSGLTPASANDLVNPDVLESYLGDSCVLEIFDREMRDAGHALAALKGKPAVEGDPDSIPGVKSSEVSVRIPEKLLSIIVDRVVRRISPDIIREVAWDVVPELSEILIRRALEEQKQP